MMDEVIRQYGLESIITITFCVAAEDATISDTILREFYDELMKQRRAGGRCTSPKRRIYQSKVLKQFFTLAC